MKILFCTPNFKSLTHGPAHKAHFFHQLGKDENGIEVRFLTEDQMKIDNFYFLSIQIPRLFWAFHKFCRAWIYYKKALDIQKEYSFDLLIFNDSILSFFASRSNNRAFRLITFLNDDYFLEPLIPSDAPSRKKMLRSCYHNLEQNIVQRSDITIVPSTYLKKIIHKQYGKKGNIHVLNNFTYLDKIDFTLRSDWASNSIIKVLFVKANFKMGRLKDLIFALGKLSSFSFQLDMAGPTSSSESLVKSWATDFVNIDLVFHGLTPQEKTFKLLQTHDILCVPSALESFGIANIEGLASGISVVSTKVGGIVEVLKNGEHGWLAEAENPADLARQLQACIDASQEERQQKAQKGRAFVETHFTYKAFRTNLRKILSSLDAKNHSH